MSDAFDWPSVEEKPLHYAHPDGYWLVCEHPERPLDGDYFADVRCPKCVMAIKAHVLRNPEARTRALLTGRAMSMADRLAQAEAWHAAHGTQSHPGRGAP